MSVNTEGLADPALVISGNLNSDGTIQLDRPPAILPGRVQVLLRPLSTPESREARLPDAPWPDESRSAPFDLPRPGVSERVYPQQACDRLPDFLPGGGEDAP